ncbi:hypothetical protein G6011_08398 [Alternaria panax]|uniref:BTB domain-containing protein n=1 Tax=Alternaria panax TaxID=48097 RepID=A0AAD4FJ29_9PLEO|nr:hypothetical protein G6011_08398 [Alternaria panax]
MNQQDRKRVFGKAFNGASDLSSHPHRKALRSVAALSVASTPQIFYTPAFSLGSDKENEDLFFPILGEFTKSSSDAKHHLPLPPRTSSLRGLSELQLASNDFERSYTIPGDHESGYFDEHVLGAYPCAPGPVVFADPDTVAIQIAPPTPSALHFQTLSLQDPPRRYLPDLTIRSALDLNATRTSVFVLQSVELRYCFSPILKDDVVMFFDKGKQVMKIDKYLLCTESRFFAPMLDGPTVEGQTRCIRVRDDFPYAIGAMIQYMQEGNYTFNPNMRLEHANITLLDLHVHAYVVGNKYDVAKLCDHAIGEYLNIATMVLSMGITPGEDPTDFSNHAVNGDHKDPDASPATSVLNSFLDSLVLIWRNTLNGDDMLRQGVLELLKPYINQLMRLKFFQTLMMDMVGFGDDLVHSLAEDGFDIQAFPAAGWLQQKIRVKFGSAWNMA